MTIQPGVGCDQLTMIGTRCTTGYARRRCATPDFWAIGPTGAALGLRAGGFSLREAERLVRLKVRYERGDFRELTDTQRRRRYLLFLRWLAQHGRFSDGEKVPGMLDERSTHR